MAPTNTVEVIDLTGDDDTPTPEEVWPQPAQSCPKRANTSGQKRLKKQALARQKKVFTRLFSATALCEMVRCPSGGNQVAI